MEEELFVNIESGIKELVESFRAKPYSFYLESDLHCALFHILSLRGVDKACVSRLGRSKIQSSILHKEYPTKSRYKRNKKGPSTKKLRGVRGYYDLCVWDPAITFKRQFRAPGGKNEQRTMVAIEMSLNEHHDSFEWKVYWDLLKLTDPNNEVDKGYILFFVRDYPYDRTGFPEDGFISKLRDMYDHEKKVNILYVESKGAETRTILVSDTNFQI